MDTQNHKLLSYCRFDDSLLLPRSGQRQKLPENPKTVIVCLFPYYVGELPGRNVARYACVNDYHKVLGDILSGLVLQLKAAFPSEEFVPFVDNSPIREVRAAALAGLGAVGLHGMLIHEIFGSRVFIGEIVTTLELAPKTVEQKSCLKCGICVKACPTGALNGTRPFERSLCRSHISQLKRELSDWEAAQLKAGKMAWGCDICADACPLDRDVPPTFIKGFLNDITPVLTCENIHENMKSKPYNWRGAAVLLRNLDLIRAD